MSVILLHTEQLEELTKRRRDAQDLDLDNYLKVKNEVLKLVIEIKHGAELNDEILNKLTQLEKELKAAKLKTELTLDLELIRYLNTVEELNTHTQKNNEFLTNMIISSTKEYKELQKRVALAQEILQNRQELNKTIFNYFEKSKIITLSLKDLHQLFDNEADDLKLVLTSGKLIHEDKSNAENTVYEFVFAKNSSFKLSLEELSDKIQSQIKECEEAQQNIDVTKKKWKKSSEKLVEILTSIETEVL